MADAVMDVAFLHDQALGNSFDIGAVCKQPQEFHIIVVERRSFGVVHAADGAAPQIGGDPFADIGVIMCYQTGGGR